MVVTKDMKVTAADTIMMVDTMTIHGGTMTAEVARALQYFVKQTQSLQTSTQ